MGKLFILCITISLGFTVGTTDVIIEEEPCLSKTANGTKSCPTAKPGDDITTENIFPGLFHAVTNVENQSNNEENYKTLNNNTRFQPPSIFGMLTQLNTPKYVNNTITQSPTVAVTDNITYNNSNETENREKHYISRFGQHKEPILGIMNRFAEKDSKINVKEIINQNNLIEDKIKNTLLNIIKTAQEGNDQNKEQVKEAIVGMMNKLKNTRENNEELVLRETASKSKERAAPVVKSMKQTNTTEINKKSHISNGVLSRIHPGEIVHGVVDETDGPTPCTCGVFLSGQFKKGSKDQPKGEPLILQEMDTPFLNNVVGKRQCTNKCLEMIIKHIPKSSDIICATADRENIYKEKAYLFIKNFSNKWLSTNLSAGREFCCRDNTSYKCPLA